MLLTVKFTELKKRRIVKEEDYTKEVMLWERTVNVIRWEHDYELKQYIIDYKEK